MASGTINTTKIGYVDDTVIESDTATSTVTYTPTEDCWLAFTCHSQSSSNPYVQVGDVIVGQAYNSGSAQIATSQCVPVKKGQVVTFVGVNNGRIVYKFFKMIK